MRALVPICLCLALLFSTQTRQAEANSLTESARKVAVQAHSFAARQTAIAAAKQARLSAETAAFNVGQASERSSTRAITRRAYYVYLYGLRSALQAAETAHKSAIQRFRYYRRISKNDAVLPTIDDLAAARTRLAATIADVQALLVGVVNG